MNDPYASRITNVKQQVGFDPTTLRPVQNKIVTFFVGANGPFYLTYAAGDYTAERVNADIAKEVATLRAIGATPSM